MRRNPAADDARLEARLEALGPSPFCPCGERDPFALRKASKAWREAHHYLTRATDPIATITVCYNCHAKWTEVQRRHGVSFRPPLSRPERVHNALRALQAHFVNLSNTAGRLADDWEQPFEVSPASHTESDHERTARTTPLSGAH